MALVSIAGRWAGCGERLHTWLKLPVRQHHHRAAHLRDAARRAPAAAALGGVLLGTDAVVLPLPLPLPLLLSLRLAVVGVRTHPLPRLSLDR